jgi:ABC-type transport system substrate-binding protein
VIGSAEGEVYPDLAESWDISDDGLEYTFHLREGAKFHNGDEITAEDAAFSIQAYYAEEGLPYSAKFAVIDKVEAVDKYTLKITLKSPNPYFLQDLAGTRGSAVMPKKVVEELGEDFGTSPETTVGSGPFKLVEWSDTQVAYEAFEDFYRGRPYVDRVVEKFVPDRATEVLEFKAGNADIQYLYAPADQEFLGNRELRKMVHDGLRPVVWWWWFNVEKPPFDDVKVRQAINYAIDNTKVLQIARPGSVPANQFITPGLVGHDDSIQYYAQDVEKAKALLAEAGFPDGIDIKLNVWNLQESVTEAQVLAAHLQESGIRAEVVPTEFGTFVSEYEKGAYGFWLTGEALNPNTAGDMMRYWPCDAPDNPANYCNPEVDALLEQAFEELDLEKRGELLAKAERLILEDAPYVPYMYPLKAVAVQPWLHGLEDVNITVGVPGHYALVLDKVWLDEDKRDR